MLCKQSWNFPRTMKRNVSEQESTGQEKGNVMSPLNELFCRLEIETCQIVGWFCLWRPFDVVPEKGRCLCVKQEKRAQQEFLATASEETKQAFSLSSALPLLENSSLLFLQSYSLLSPLLVSVFSQVHFVKYTESNSLYVSTHLAINLFLIVEPLLIQIRSNNSEVTDRVYRIKAAAFDHECDCFRHKHWWKINRNVQYVYVRRFIYQANKHYLCSGLTCLSLTTTWATRDRDSKKSPASHFSPIMQN